MDITLHEARIILARRKQSATQYWVKDDSQGITVMNYVNKSFMGVEEVVGKVECYESMGEYIWEGGYGAAGVEYSLSAAKKQVERSS